MDRLRLFVACSLIACAAAATGAETEAELAGPFAAQVRPFVAKYCADCHTGEGAEAEVDLTADESVDAVIAAGETWRRVQHMLRLRQMPPADADQPTPAENQQVIDWIDAAVNRVDCGGPVDPGQPTLRRLNRSEYANTVRDLLGVEFQAAETFPADDAGYGFDTIGGVLSLSPLLLEKYLDAAEQVAGQAIVIDPLELAPLREAPAKELSGGSLSGDRRVLSSTGEVSLRHDFARKGEYLIRVRAYGDQAGDEPAKLSLRLEGQEVKLFEVRAVESAAETYEHRLTLEPGRRRIAAAFVNDFYNPQASDPEARDRNLAVHAITVLGPLEVRPEDYPESHRRLFSVTPGPGLPVREAAGKILEPLASRAFRRPVAAAELERLLRVVDAALKDDASFEEAVGWGLQAILVSPHFLYLVEDPPADTPEGAVWELDDYELAARLSYFLWSSMPDEALFADARRGALRANLSAQVRRMLADAKAAALVENFAMQWLQLRPLESWTPDQRRFPAFDDALRRAMAEESRRFFEAVLREDRSLLELIDADFTFLNERLARHYGIPDVKGDEFRRVAIGAGRGGVLTQASVLAVTSNPGRTSPVKRGKWILENILGTPPPPPPPNVPQLAEDRRAEQAASLRQRLEQHRADPSCAACHRQMDALGFALENFDPTGAWRTKDGPFAIDAAGELPDGSKFSGPEELKELLRESRRDQFVRCFSEKMLIYALGRGLEPQDRCVVDQLVEALARENYRMSSLIGQIVLSDPFQKRRTPTE